MSRSLRPQFPTTHWSLVHDAAGDPLRTQTKNALVDLLRRYSPALRCHIRLKYRTTVDDAEDLLQSFFAEKLIQDQFVKHADERRGRFRSFVLRVLDNFVVSRFRKSGRRVNVDQSAKVEFVIDSKVESGSNNLDVFDRAWAKEVLEQATGRMRDECFASGQQVIWHMFEARILVPIQSGEPAPSYKSLVERFQLESPVQATNRVITAKRIFARILRQIVGEYAADPAEIDEEIKELRRILSQSSA